MTTRLAPAIAKSVLAFVALCILLSPRPAFADDVIFSNLGPGNSFATSSSWAIAGSTSLFGSLLGGRSESIAESFTPSANFDLSQVLLPLSFTAGTNGVDIFLTSSVSGLPGGTPLESWSVTGIATTPAFTLEDLSAAGVQPLYGGTTYWIVVAPIASDTSAGWAFNDTGNANEFASDNGSGWNLFPPDSVAPALEVTGTAPVPEPSTLLLLGAGLLALAPLIRRRLPAALRRSDRRLISRRLCLSL